MLVVAVLPVLVASPAGAVSVGTSAELVAAVEDGTVTEITLTASIVLTAEPVRPLGAAALSIEGGGFTLTAAPASRVLSAFNPTGALTVRDLTVTGGAPGGGQGAGIAWGGPVTAIDSLITDNHAFLSGGGIYAIGSTRLQNTVVVGNSAGDTGSGVFVQAAIEGPTLVTIEEGSSITDNTGGDAVHSQGNLTVIDSSISDNTAGGALVNGAATVSRSALDDNEGPGISTEVGGIQVAESSVSGNAGHGIDSANVANVVRSMVSDNAGDGVEAELSATVSQTTLAGNGGDGVYTNGTAFVSNSTVHGNEGDGVDSDLVLAEHSTITDNDEHGIQGAEATVEATVVAGSGDANCDADVTSNGHNVADDLSCGLGQPTDLEQVGIDPGLGPLADNGGLTPTRLPAVGSLLVDAIPAGDCLIAFDQRAVDRPTGDGCDIGAVERTSSDLTPTGPTPGGPGGGGPGGSGPGVGAVPAAPPASPVVAEPTSVG